MGWKQTVRSMQAAARKAEREQEQHARRAQRTLDSEVRAIEAEAKKILSRVQRFDSQCERDAIKALNLRYEENTGFQADPIDISGEYFSGEVLLVDDDPPEMVTRFSPAGQANERWEVEPLGLLLFRYGMCIAFRVTNHDKDYRIRLNWMKQSEPRESAVYLIDADDSEYLYPIASSMKGEVAQGHPRVGIMMFELPRTASNELQIHFSGVKLDSNRGKAKPFSFKVLSQTLAADIGEAKSQRPISDRVRDSIDAASRQMKQQLMAPQSAGSSGCLIWLVATGGLVSFMCVLLVVPVA